MLSFIKVFFTCTESPEIVSVKDSIFFQFLNCLFCWLFLFKIIVSSAVSSENINTFCEIPCSGHSWNPNPVSCKSLQYGQADDVQGPRNDCSTLPYLRWHCQKMNNCISVSKHVSISGNLPCSFMQNIFNGMLLERPMTAK